MAPRKTKKQPEPVLPKPPEYPRVMETFYVPFDLVGHRMSSEPSCFNGIIQIKKYRITVEEVEEPIEVLQARLIELWETTDNHHHWGPLQSAARKLGFLLDPANRGKRAPAKTW